MSLLGRIQAVVPARPAQYLTPQAGPGTGLLTNTRQEEKPRNHIQHLNSQAESLAGRGNNYSNGHNYHRYWVAGAQHNSLQSPLAWLQLRK